MRPSAHLLQALGRARLAPRSASPLGGLGTRRSGDVGDGMDFADYRDYAPGDVIRHVDARQYARHGRFIVRQFEVERQMSVTIVVDCSGSMQIGNGEKQRLAHWLGCVFSYLALRGDDRVQLVFWNDGQPALSGVMSGSKNYHKVVEWFDNLVGREAEPPFNLDMLGTHLPAGGLVILLSDFWSEEISQQVLNLAASGAEIWAFQLLNPEEVDPSLIGQGDLTLLDRETGRELAVSLNTSTLAVYKQAVLDHQAELRNTLTSVGGQLFVMPTASDAEEFVLTTCREFGLIS